MKKCQMKYLPVRGSVPVIAYLRRRENPAFTDFGTAFARALNTASIISSAQWLVLMHTGAGGLAFTISPFGAITVRGPIEPSFFATS